jgi:signal transduction histidine kinase
MQLFKHPNSQTSVQKTNAHIILNHILAGILPFTGLSLGMLMGDHIESALILILLPIVALCSWIGGVSSGILSTFIAFALINYYILNLSENPSESNYIYVLQSILFVAEGVFLSFAIDSFRNRTRLKEYKKHERELNDKILLLEKKNKSYEKEIHTRDEFLSIASHELKTPLTSMLLQTQTALHNIKNVSVAKFSFENLLKMLHSVENQTLRLSKMINDLLSVSLIASGRLELEYDEVNLEKIIKDVISDFQAKIEKENISLSFTPGEKIVGKWDKIRIEQAISNFISNSIKYGNGKPIEIILKKKGKNAELTIADHGIGISRDKQKHIFELFARGVSPDQYRGLGIGLFISQRIIYAHGGEIEVKSKLGKGTEFKTTLPIRNFLKTENKKYQQNLTRKLDPVSRVKD